MSLTADGEIANSTIRSVVARLEDGKAVVQHLPGGGTLNIDRLLPFLFIYRNDIDNPDKAAGTFVSSEASYLLAPGNVRRRKGLKRLIEAISQLATERFGAFLLLEIRTLPIQREQTDAKTGELQLPSPRFVIQVPSELPITASSLKCTLRRIVLYGRKAIVETDRDSRSLNCLLQRSFLDRQNVSFICVYIDPIYRNSKSDVTYDALLAELRRGVARALKRTSFSFVMERTNTNPQHYWVLGRRKLPQNVWDVDRQLAEVSSSFKFLVAVTPVNAERAWIEFRERKFSKTPKFQYSPLELDPLLLKRTLMNIRVDEVDDPTLAHVFRQTQDELDRQITMLADLDTPRFLYGSMQVFGVVEPSLLKLAHQILRMPDDQQEAETVSAEQFSVKANDEINYYQQQAEGFSATASVCQEMYSGLLVSGGKLLIGSETKLSENRMNALLQHEVGTHLVTYLNGDHQPLRLLKVGLAGYDALQEGLAVFSEYLVGGLSIARLRILAARVVATDAMIRGEHFVATYRLLVDLHQLDSKAAFTVALRVYRGGGLTKDAVYLRGLVQIMKFLTTGGDFDLLLIGKFAFEHIAIVRELLHREILRPPQFRPRYLDDESAHRRLMGLGSGKSVLQLLLDFTCEHQPSNDGTKR